MGVCLGIAGCVAPQKPTPPAVVIPPAPLAAHPLDHDDPSFLRPANIANGVTPVRVGVILPFIGGAAATRSLSAAMMKAAALAIYDAKNPNIVLMTADEGSTPADAAAAATKLLAQGAEIIIGPLFGPSVSAVAPIARDRGVPVLAFSTEKSVAGNGVYLLSFLPQNEVTRVIRYAAAQGHHNFAAMAPQNAYGDVVAGAFGDAVKAAGGASVDIERFAPNTTAFTGSTTTIAKSNADAIMLAQGGAGLRAIAPSLSFNGLDPAKGQAVGHRAYGTIRIGGT